MLIGPGCAHNTIPDEDAPSAPPAGLVRQGPGSDARPARMPGYPMPYKVMGQWYQPLPDARGFRQEGTASWYGRDFHGRPTSSGEPYDMHGVSAAHKILPLGTWVRVYNLENRRYLDLRINDRGPFVAGRVIDLSYGAALRLGMADNGLAPVRVVALGAPAGPASDGRVPAAFTPVDYRRGNFTIQVGAFRSQENAQRLAQSLVQAYRVARVQPYYSHHGSDLLHRVVVGRINNLDEAEKYEAMLRTNGFGDAFMVAE